MFAGFKVNIEDFGEYYPRYYSDGLKMFENQKNQVKSGLSKYLNADGSLSEKLMEDEWFPKIDAHVFLSHAHTDEGEVISFAGWLWRNFKIRSFIDSCVWGYSDDLLKKIDKRYCAKDRYEDGRIKTYSYELRNTSTSNVHMILSTAIMKMIDNTECLMFINTPSSVKWEDITGETATRSPWIYNELLMAKLIRNRSRKSHRETIMGKSFVLEHMDAADMPNIEWVIDTKHLTDVGVTDLDILSDCVKCGIDDGVKHNAYTILDMFYEQNGIDLKENFYG